MKPLDSMVRCPRAAIVTTFTFFDADSFGGLSNVSFTVEGLGAGYSFTLSDAGSGDIDLVVTTAHVPEPQTSSRC